MNCDFLKSVVVALSPDFSFRPVILLNGILIDQINYFSQVTFELKLLPKDIKGDFVQFKWNPQSTTYIVFDEERLFREHKLIIKQERCVDQVRKFDLFLRTLFCLQKKFRILITS